MELLSIRLIAKPLLGVAGSMAETRPPSRSTHGDAHDHRSQVPLPPCRRRRHDRTATGGRTSCALDLLHQHSAKSDPMGDGLRLRRGVQEPRLRGAEEGPARADDRLAGLVAGRLRPLRPALHPHGLAQRRHLPHRRRPRRRRPRPAALRAAQQLARQRQPRQGAPPAVADQAEVRPARSPGPT